VYLEPSFILPRFQQSSIVRQRRIGLFVVIMSSITPRPPAVSTNSPHDSVPVETGNYPPLIVGCLPEIAKCKNHSKCKSQQLPPDDLRPCNALECKNLIHWQCCDDIYKTKNAIVLLDKSGLRIPFCKLGCHSKILSNLNKKLKGTTRGWRTDSPKGPDDFGGSSEAILLHWLLSEGNYARYRGHKNGGKSKVQFHKELAEKMNAANVQVTRNSDQVGNKIQMFEEKFRVAFKWANETGQGVTDELDFRKAVLKRCHVYYDLLPIMQDRANAKPLASSDDIDLSVDDSDSKLCDDVDELDADFVEQTIEEDHDDAKKVANNQPNNPRKRNINDIADSFDDERSTHTPVGNKYFSDSVASVRGTSSTKSITKSARKKSCKKEEIDRTQLFLQSMDNRKAQLEEQARHNKVIEMGVAVETKIKETQEKIKLLELQEKQQEMRMRSVERVQSLKREGISGPDIVALFPELKDIVEIIFPKVK
jgi:hypothetical protein